VKDDCLLKLQLKFPYVFVTPVFNVDIYEYGITADPSLSMDTSCQLDSLGTELLRQIQFI